MGIRLLNAGDPYYREQNLEFAYGKNLGRLEIGVRFDYMLIQTSGYLAIRLGSSGIGFRFLVSDKLITSWFMVLLVFGNADNTITEMRPQLLWNGSWL